MQWTKKSTRGNGTGHMHVLLFVSTMCMINSHSNWNFMALMVKKMMYLGKCSVDSCYVFLF